MHPEDRYFLTGTEAEQWQRYCGFLELSIDEFMQIQEHLLLKEIELAAASPLGKKVMKGQQPKTVDEFRQMVPITTYDDYEPYLSERREDVLGVKPYAWCHSAGRRGNFKWVPLSSEVFEKSSRNFIASMILATCQRRGEVNIAPGLRILATLPPPPYASGIGYQHFTQQFSCRTIPPPETVKHLEFQDRMRKGFEIALKDGVDIITGLGSVMVKIGEGFGKQGQSRKLSKSMFHPKVILHMLQAMIRSRIAKRPMLPKDLWSPKGILCGGLDTGIYKRDIAHYWGTEAFDFYVSAETMFIAMQAWNKKAMTFIPDSVFLEFIPHSKRSGDQDKDYQPATVLMNQVKEGKLYEVIITQFHGLPLLRCRLDDIIKVVSLRDEETGVNLPQILIYGKVGSTIDLAGLAELDEKTIWQALANTGVKFIDWTAVKEYDQSQAYLRLYVELGEERQAEDIANLVNEQLKVIDTDYKDIDTYLKFQPVRVTLLSPGTFQRYMEEKRRQGADLAHLKPIHMNAPETVIRNLLQLSEVTKQ